MPPPSNESGSPIDQSTDDKVAVAVTETPRSATVLLVDGESPSHSHVQKFTAILFGSGPRLITGLGIRNSPIACCAKTAGSGGGGGAGAAAPPATGFPLTTTAKRLGPLQSFSIIVFAAGSAPPQRASPAAG